MIDTDGIRKAIERIYQFYESANQGREVPLRLQARPMTHFAQDYIAAAAVVSEHSPQRVLPMLQLTGHAVEVSLKACLASAGVHPPTGHDLLELYGQAHELGFELDAPAYAAIVHLQHFYFRDLATGTKFKSRYPTKRTETLGGSVPDNSVYTAIVSSLCEQAYQRGADDIFGPKGAEDAKAK
jgi:hypothetical protein